MPEEVSIPDCIKCWCCGEVSKRAVKVPCCSAIACRACATKSVTRNKVCWNAECGKPMKTGDLINDEALREAVDKFNAERKAAESKKIEEEKATPEQKFVQEKKPSENGGPPSKKTKPNAEIIPQGVSLAKMKERNEEFDRCMLPSERASKELRFGAQLELMLEFQADNASCLICSEQLKSEFTILKHIQLKHKKEYEQMKTVLGASNLNTLNMFIHKAIRSEFLYQQKQVFPITVNY